jgi:adenylate kinase
MTTLDPSEEDQFHKDVNTYVAKHDLLGMFQRLLTEVTVTKPKDPISFLISVLEKPKEGFRKIIVLGKTNTKKEELCQRIANEYKLVHITLEELIQQKGGIVNAFKQALNRSEVTSQGWIISGFPQDRIQALQLQELAQYPNHVLVLETNTPSQDDYNVHFDANIADVLSCFEGVVTLINADVYPGKVYSSVKAKLDGKPNQLKVLVLGAPGSGKTTQCERIVDTFRVVRVNLEELPYEIVNDPTHVPTSLVEEAQNSIKKNSFSNEFQIKILKWRLSQNDCLERGWVVDGFSKDVRVFDTEAIFPDYVIELTGVDEKTIKERIDGRRMNPETHKIYHVRHNPPGDIRVIQIPKDKQTPSLAPYEQNITTIRNELGRAVTQVDAKLPLSVVSAQVINTIRGQVQNGKFCVHVNS